MTAPTARQVLDAATSEDELLTAITEWATLRGWRWHHVRRSDKALQMGHAGFPDLCLARAGEVIFAELKRHGENQTAEQFAWHRAISGGAQFYVWRPADLDNAIEVLR